MRLPATINSKYIYVRNNPVNSIDPSGQFEPFTIALIASFVIGGTIKALSNDQGKSGISDFESFFIGGAIGVGAVYAGAFAGGGIAGGAVAGFFTGSADTLVFNKQDRNPFSENNRGKLVASVFVGALVGGVASGAKVQLGGLDYSTRQYTDVFLDQGIGFSGSITNVIAAGIIDLINSIGLKKKIPRPQ